MIMMILIIIICKLTCTFLECSTLNVRRESFFGPHEGLLYFSASVLFWRGALLHCRLGFVFFDSLCFFHVTSSCRKGFDILKINAPLGFRKGRSF